MTFYLKRVRLDWTTRDALILDASMDVPFPDNKEEIRYLGYICHRAILMDEGSATLKMDLFGAKLQPKARIVSVSIDASDPLVTCDQAHGLTDGVTVFILGDGSDHTLPYGIVDNATATTFTLPGVTTVAGTGGTVHLSETIYQLAPVAAGVYELGAGDKGMGPYAAVWLDSNADNIVDLFYHEM